MKVGEEQRQAIAAALWGLTGKEATLVAQDLAEQLGVSIAHIYHLSRDLRGTGRARRRDAGQARGDIEPAHFEAVRQFTAHYDFAAWHAIKACEQNGLIPSGLLTEARYNEWLRTAATPRTRLKKDVIPARHWEADEPNAIHHFDTTKLEELHLRDGVLTWNHAANRKNARGEKPAAIWLYSLVDDYSRCKFAYLYPSLNKYNHLDFFYRAWSQKEKPSEFPFFGTPRHLYMDRGGSNQALLLATALKKLGVHTIPTEPSTWTPHGARKHGKIERVFQDYAEWLKEFQLRPHPWDEAQASLYQFVLFLNRRTHRETGAAPFARWLGITRPRHMPDADLYAALYYEHEQRTLGKYCEISLDAHCYVLPEVRPWTDYIGRKVEVYRKPGSYERVIVVCGQQEIEVNERTDNVVRPAFSYPRDARALTAVEEARASGAGFQPAGSLRLFAQSGSQDGRLTAYLPRRGEAFDESQLDARLITTEAGGQRHSFVPARMLSRGEVARELLAAGVFALDDDDRLSESDIAYLDTLMAGQATIEDDEVQAAIRAARTATATGTEG